MATYHPDNPVRLSAVFKDTSDADADPTTVTVRYRKPNGTEIALAYVDDVEVVKDSTGNYHLDVTPTLADHGVWRYRWKGTGAIVAASDGEFTVPDSTFS